LQNRFFDWWRPLSLPFYLTGGTALGRFYLNHRYSEDIDFFVNANPDFNKYILKIKDNLQAQFKADITKALITDDFLLGKNNSLGINKMKIEEAKVDSRQKTEDGRRKTEDGRQKTEDGRRKTEDGRRKTEDGRRKTEDGRRKTEDRRRKAEDGRRKTEDGRQKTEGGRQ
jgi:hypothetical protein